MENSTPWLLSVVVHQVQDEGHAHGARLVVVGDQEVAADVQVAVVFFVEARGLLDVLVHRVFGDGQAVVLLDPALFFQRGRLEVDPDRLERESSSSDSISSWKSRPLASEKMLSMDRFVERRPLQASNAPVCGLKASD
jgi:hypothetical protein